MEQASKTPITLDLAQLPRELEVPGFAEEYEQHRQANEDSPFATLMQFVGYGLLIVGVLTLIFGPDTVMVNRFTGPDFFQFVLLNPGPIVTLGFLLASGAALLDGKKQQLLPETYLLSHYPFDARGELDEGLQLQVSYLGNSRFQLSAVPRSAEAAAAQP
jgi:hypothetical protein